MKNKIYLDYAATTPVDPRVIRAMIPYFAKVFGNTMSLHSFGRETKKALEESRKSIADFIGAQPLEIIFTGSATESNNFALKGIAFENRERGNHIIISSIEHACVMESAAWLEKQGFEITRLKVDKYGFINLEDLKRRIKKETILVSIMHANNEIGTIQPIPEIGKICKEKGVYFHTDVAQSLDKELIDVNEMNVDLLTGSAHKLYGPKGVGLLFIRQGTRIKPLLHGGGHEFGLRSSTSNVAGIVGFAKACDICKESMVEENKRLKKLRNKLIKGILDNIDDSFLNGHPIKRLSNNVNIAFSFVEGESLLIQFDFLGVAVSTGSACSSSKLTSSHVLTAIGLKPNQIQSSLRFSLGRWTEEKDIDYVLEILPGIVEKLRKISPLKK